MTGGLPASLLPSVDAAVGAVVDALVDAAVGAVVDVLVDAAVDGLGTSAGVDSPANAPL